MTVKTLEYISVERVIECFLLAFENYYVKMPINNKYYIDRWAAAKVDFSLSYGMFDKEILVGFIIHAVDHRFGIKTAFNTGTGVIPKYRGNKITKAIYDFAIDDLKSKGIEKSILEVIQKNEKAIKAYRSVGFDITKEYNCFAGEIQMGRSEVHEVKEINKDEFNWHDAPNQKNYSWDFQKETVKEVDYKYFQVIFNDQVESYFIFNLKNKYLAQFDVYENHINAWERLFTAIDRITNEVKIINVDSKLVDKSIIIQKANLKNTVNQYEMELILTGGNNGYDDHISLRTL